MQNYFDSLSSYIQSQLKNGQHFTCYFSGEESDFVRFNQAKVRQAGFVTQGVVDIDLIEGSRHATSSIGISGNLDVDIPLINEALRAELQEDPYLLYSTEVHNNSIVKPSLLPDAKQVTQEILQQVKDLDFVGIYAAGATHRGFSNSFGQRNWLTSYSFNLDFSSYLRADKAVKSNYAGVEWNPQDFENNLNSVRHQLEILKRPAKTLTPGQYRSYFTPTAFHSVIELLNWSAFSEKALRTKHSPLCRLQEGTLQFDPSFSLSENTQEGLSPSFQANGFIKPTHVSLIEKGKLVNCLVSPRSAKEYGLKTNGANSNEAMESVDIAAGNLSRDSMLKTLDTGIYINNLWYLNYSDKPACRMTGMTRFATFWVENGEIVAPLNVMRFDDSLFDMLGEKLVGFTKERDFIIDDSTYEERSLKTARLPGMLVNNFALTL